MSAANKRPPQMNDTKRVKSRLEPSEVDALASLAGRCGVVDVAVRAEVSPATVYRLIGGAAATRHTLARVRRVLAGVG